MGIFRQISIELMPLIYVDNQFPCSILDIFYLHVFSSNLVFELISWRSGLGS